MEYKIPCDFAHNSEPIGPFCLGCSPAPAMTRCSAAAWAAIFSFVRTISWRFGSKTNSPASRAAAEQVLPAPNTPLTANPVRPSHKANTIALKVAGRVDLQDGEVPRGPHAMRD